MTNEEIMDEYKINFQSSQKPGPNEPGRIKHVYKISAFNAIRACEDYETLPLTDYHKRCFKDYLGRRPDDSVDQKTFEDLRGAYDLREYYEIKKTIDSSDLVKKLNQTFGLKKRYKKVLCSCSGDYQHELRNEPLQYVSKVKLNQQAKQLVINVRMTFSGSVTGRDITRYGTTAAALVECLEAAGVSVELNLLNEGASLFNDSDEYIQIYTNVKKSGQLMAPQRMAKCFSANYYRRVTFSHYAMLGHLLDKRIDRGLTRPKEYKEAFKVEPGVLTINNTNSLESTEETLKALLGALTGRIKAA